MKSNLILFLCIMPVAASICCHARGSKTGGYRAGEYRLYVLTENQGTRNLGIFGDIPENVKEKHAPDGTFPKMPCMSS